MMPSTGCSNGTRICCAGSGFRSRCDPPTAGRSSTGTSSTPTEYRMADPGLTDEERAALFLAAQIVRLGGEPAAPEAILKLGGTRLTGAVEPLAADLGAGAETLGELFEAVNDKRTSRFTLPTARTRRVAPYGHRASARSLVRGGATNQRPADLSGRSDGGDLGSATTQDAFDRPSDFDLKASSIDCPGKAGGDVGQAAGPLRSRGGLVGGPPARRPVRPPQTPTVPSRSTVPGGQLGLLPRLGPDALAMEPRCWRRQS